MVLYLKACPNCLGGDVESSAYDNSMKCLQCSWTPKPRVIPKLDSKKAKHK